MNSEQAIAAARYTIRHMLPGAAKSEGTVYLLHFDRPYGHAAHYTGWTTNLDARLQAHRDGNGARLVAVAANAGIGFELARTWPGDRNRERQLKQSGATRRCPICKQADEMDEPADPREWRPHIFPEVGPT